MRKYFVAFLPIKGEIKEGSKVKYKPSKVYRTGIVKEIKTQLWGFRCMVESLDETPFVRVGELFEAKDEDLLLIDKPYLCSKDINLGDTVYCTLLQQFIENIQGCYTESMVKVLGIISPGAIWVKEGDQFTKEDLLVDGIGVNWNDNSSGYTFKIKCSQCQTFH